MLMESVIDGKLQDPVEALTEEENRRAREKEERENTVKAIVSICQKYGVSKEDTINDVSEMCSLKKEIALEKVKIYWGVT